MPEIGKSYLDIDVVGGFITLGYPVTQHEAERIVKYIVNLTGKGKCKEIKVRTTDSDIKSRGVSSVAANYHIIWCD